MTVLIRHGKKKWKNGTRTNDGYSFDPPLIDGEDIVSLRDSLLQTSGEPVSIFCSPFLRCRQTAEILSEEQIPIRIVPDLREYLGNWNGRHRRVDLDPETQRHIRGPVVESFNDFKHRAIHLDRYLQPNVWIVSHGLVIETLYEHLTGEKIEVLEAGFVIYNPPN